MRASDPLRVGDNKTGSLSAGTYSFTSIEVGNHGTLQTTGAVTIYVTGDVDFGNSAGLTVSGGPVTIYVNGSVELGNSVTLGSPGQTGLEIIARSNLRDWEAKSFEAGNNFTLYGTLYGKSTDVTLGNDARLYGSIIGRTVKLGNNAMVHYDRAMSGRKLCHDEPRFSFVRGTWRELYPTN
jgi:hypothetical protein